MTLDLPGFLVMRLSEHALHTWDVEVITDATATVPSEAAGLIAHNLGMIAGFSAKPDGESSEIHIETTAPSLHFLLTTTAESVSLNELATEGTADLRMPTEALVRLVYGRLDPEHTTFEKADESHAVLGRLRTIFPGF